MKTIVSMLVAAIICSTSMAQSSQERWDNDHRQKDRRNVVYRQANNRMSNKELMIRRVNRKYDYKIYQVKQNRYMNNRQKKKAIKDLEENRQREIRRIYANGDQTNKRYQKGRRTSGRNTVYDRNDRYPQRERCDKKEPRRE